MKVADATVLVTGANRGLGLAFAREALARGARKVYAAARDPASVSLPGAVPMRLDVTDEAQVAEAARIAGDTTIVVNNAGIATFGGFLADGAIESAHRQLDVNFFGPLRMARAFAPVLAEHGGGALVNMLSVGSWINSPLLGIYGTTKSAAWALTNGLRIELAPQGTQVLAVHAGFIDTDMTRDVALPKVTPQQVARAAFDALERGELQVLADDISRQVHRGLSAEPAVYLQPMPR